MKDSYLELEILELKVLEIEVIMFVGGLSEPWLSNSSVYISEF